MEFGLISSSIYIICSRSYHPLSKMCDFDVEAFAKAVPVISSTLLSCVTGVDKLSEYGCSLSDKIVYTLNQVDSLKVRVPELRDRLLDCKSLLLKSHITADTVVRRIKKCLEYGDLSQKERDNIVSMMQEQKSEPLSNYLEQLGRYFEQCDKCYQNFKSYDKEAQDTCKVGKKECNKRLNDASSSRQRAKQGRSALKWGGIAAGLGGLAGAAVVAGFFTAGIGTPIVLGIGAAASGVATVGGATATTVGSTFVGGIEDSYKKIEEALDTISKGFEKMKEIASDIDRDMLKLTEEVKSIKFDVAIVREDKDFDSFNRAFKLLLESISKTKRGIKSYHERIQNGKEAVEKII